MNVKTLLNALDDNEFNTLLLKLKEKNVQINGYKNITKVRRLILLKEMKESTKLNKTVLSALSLLQPSIKSLKKEESFEHLISRLNSENIISSAAKIALENPEWFENLDETFGQLIKEKKENNLGNSNEEPANAEVNIIPLNTKSNNSQNETELLTTQINALQKKVNQIQNKNNKIILDNKTLKQENKALNQELKKSTQRYELETDKHIKSIRNLEVVLKATQTENEKQTAEIENYKSQIISLQKKLNNYIEIFDKLDNAGNIKELQECIQEYILEEHYNDYCVEIREKAIDILDLVNTSSKAITKEIKKSSLDSHLLCNSKIVVIPRINIKLPSFATKNCIYINEDEFNTEIVVDNSILEKILIISNECKSNNCKKNIINDLRYKEKITEFANVLEFIDFMKRKDKENEQ